MTTTIQHVTSEAVFGPAIVILEDGEPVDEIRDGITADMDVAEIAEAAGFDADDLVVTLRDNNWTEFRVER